MQLCEPCSRLPERQDSLPPDAQTAHLGPERRVGASSPHFPKKYVRECQQCGARWGVVHVNTWDSKWMRIEQSQQQTQS
jgi:hypothetical protein